MDGRVLLAQVIEGVIGREAEVTIDSDPKINFWSRARMTSNAGNGRSAEIRTTAEWSDATFSDPDVCVTVTHVNEEDKNGEDKEDVVRKLAVLVREYLRGKGSVVHKRGVFHKRPFLIIEADGEWQIGRQSASIPYPEQP